MVIFHGFFVNAYQRVREIIPTLAEFRLVTYYIKFRLVTYDILWFAQNRGLFLGVRGVDIPQNQWHRIVVNSPPHGRGVADPSMNWHPLTKNHRLNVYECLWIRVICTKVVYTYIYNYSFTYLHVYILICLFIYFQKWICRDIECASTNIRLDHACIHLYTSISQHIHKRVFFDSWPLDSDVYLAHTLRPWGKPAGMENRMEHVLFRGSICFAGKTNDFLYVTKNVNLLWIRKCMITR